MAAGGNFGENKAKEIEREPLRAETSPVSAPDKLVESSDSPSPEPPGQDKGAACDAAAASIKEEKDSPAFTDDCETKHVPCSSSEEIAGKASIFSFLSFPQKLWQLVDSDEFKTIWWGHCGNCVVIDEEMFKVEVLGRKRPLRVFETESMKSFVRQLNLYGFTKMKRHFQRSASLPEFLAEEDAFSAHRKLLVYYNPNFRRDYPHLLENCKRRAALKRRALAAPALQAELDESHLSSTPGAQPGWGAAAGQEEDPLAAAPAEDAQPPAPAQFPLPKRRPKAAPQARSAHPDSQAAAPTLPDKRQPPNPSLLPPCSTQSPAATPAPSLYHTLPLMVPSLTPCPPQLEHPPSPPACPKTPALQAPWAALPPFHHPPFAMPLLAAAFAAAALRPPDWQPPAAPHCPTCTCGPDTAAAGDRLAP